MKTFAEYCKDMGDQNISEFFGLFNKAVNCPVCGSNLEARKAVAGDINLTGQKSKDYTCRHCNQEYSMDLNTGKLDKVYGVDIA
jgi:hypothetical protein